MPFLLAEQTWDGLHTYRYAFGNIHSPVTSLGSNQVKTDRMFMGAFRFYKADV